MEYKYNNGEIYQGDCLELMKDCKWFGINNVCNNYYSEYCGL